MRDKCLFRPTSFCESMATKIKAHRQVFRKMGKPVQNKKCATPTGWRQIIMRHFKVLMFMDHIHNPQRMCYFLFAFK